MKNRFQKNNRQKGMLMFELLIVLAVAAFALTMYMKREKLDIDQVRAKADGLMIAQVNNAIRKRIADEGTSMIAGTYTGVDWLHDTSCPNGLASTTYLPCHVSGKFHFELTPVSSVSNTSGSVSVSTNFGTIKTGSQSRIDLAKLAALAANNENIHGETPISGTFYSYQVDTVGQLIATASYGADLDQWLRTDGTNAMKASLDLGNNQIKNLGAAIAGTACTGTGLIAQQGGAILSCESGFWKKQGSDFWRDPVASFANLPMGDPIGTTRLTHNTGRAFRWSGSAWTPLAVDQNGNMTVPGTTVTNDLQINGVVSENAACPQNGRVAGNGNGLILSCQSGRWAKQPSNIDQGTQCGSYDSLGGQYITCKGRHPASGCPAGYAFQVTGSAASHWFYTCAKT